MPKVKLDQKVQLNHGVTTDQAMARTVTSPECLSASVLTLCQNLDHAQVEGMVAELKHQSALVHSNDLSRAESMLIAQAHTLDGLFAKLTSKALSASQLDTMERYLRLALKAQNQARATLQTLAELKEPKQIAFVNQANIGNQVQVNNGNPNARSRAKKNRNPQNELLEVTHGERLDSRTTSTTGGADPTVAAMEQKHRSHQCRR